MTVKLYDSNLVAISIAGIPIVSGFGPDEKVRVEMITDDFTDVVGVDGEVARGKSNDGRATVFVTLLQTSDANVLLSALRAADLLSVNGSGVGPLEIFDAGGTSAYVAPHCWITRSPDATFGPEVGTREWAIRCDKLEAVTGGNTSA